MKADTNADMVRTRITSTLWAFTKSVCSLRCQINNWQQTMGSLANMNCCHGYSRTCHSNEQSNCIAEPWKHRCRSQIQRRGVCTLNVPSTSRQWRQYCHCHTNALHRRCSLVFPNVRRLHLDNCCYRRVNEPKRVKSSTSKQTNVLVDEHWAERIVSVLNEHFDVSHPDTVIFDSNAGSGVLSSELLRCGAARVIAWEGRDKFWSSLKTLEEKYSDRLLLQKKCFFRSKKYAQTVHQEVPGQPYKGVPTVGWNSESPLKVVGCTNTLVMTIYIMSLAYSLVNRTGLSFYGRVQHYLLVTGMEVKLLREIDACWTSMIMTRILFYKIFFDFEILLKVPVTAFSPPRILSGWKKLQYDADHLFLTKLVLKKDVYETVCAQSDMLVFLNMLGELNKRKHERLIPLLDHWFPGFGLTLLKLGYTMMDRVKSISIDDITKIYKVLLVCPTYSESGFKQALKERSSPPVHEEDDDDQPSVDLEEPEDEFYQSHHL